MEWTEDVIGRLKALWAEGHSTAEIGRRLGVSKNAVVGKAHRLSLAARPSPIRRGEPGAAKRRSSIRRVTGPTLPTMAGPVAGPAGAPALVRAAAPPSPAAPAPVHVPVRAPIHSAPVHTARSYSAPEQRASEHRSPDLRAIGRAPGGRLVACCWPIGEPGTRSFRFCDVGSLPGKPYCSAHAALAYVKVRDRREDAA